MKIEILFGRRLIAEVVKSAKYIGRFEVPEGARKPQSLGKVVAVGSLREFAVGDYVIYAPDTGLGVMLNDKLCVLLSKDEVLGKVVADGN